jgi:hypothetical protein
MPYLHRGYRSFECGERCQYLGFCNGVWMLPFDRVGKRFELGCERIDLR